MIKGGGAATLDARISVLVIEDHQMVGESILRSLEDESDMDVAGMAMSAEAGIAMAVAHRPQVVVMDYRLPDLDGVAAARRLRTACPEANVVLLTGSGGDDVLEAAVDAGCCGYLDKSRGFAELSRAIRLAAAGEMALLRPEVETLVPRLMRSGRTASARLELTPREQEVLSLMAEGLANKVIAQRLGLRLNTVRNHVQNLLTKLSAHSKLEAVATATRAGLIAAPRTFPPDNYWSSTCPPP